MNKWATKSDKLKARVTTNYIFAQFDNCVASVAVAAGVKTAAAQKWFQQGFISQSHVSKLISSPRLKGKVKKQDCRPDIDSWN